MQYLAYSPKILLAKFRIFDSVVKLLVKDLEIHFKGNMIKFLSPLETDSTMYKNHLQDYTTCISKKLLVE